MNRLIVSQCRDPAWNLALEEYLIAEKVPVLYLWQNGPSVIVGRNQNPRLECDPALLNREGVRLVRRKSGGGAVYHDLGNLNITMVTEKYPSCIEENFRFLQAVLKDLGIDARVSGRNDLEIDGRKCSGSAFYETEDRFCHHCTMLLDVDLDRMNRYLTPSGLKLRSKGIASVRSRVVNLCQLRPDLTVERLIGAFKARSGLIPEEISRDRMETIPQVARNAARYQSWAWTFGESPEYNLSREEKFPWGLVKAELMVTDGLVRSCRIYTDSLQTQGFDLLASSLSGLPHEKAAFETAFSRSGLPEPIANDLLTLLTE